MPKHISVENTKTITFIVETHTSVKTGFFCDESAKWRTMLVPIDFELKPTQTAIEIATCVCGRTDLLGYYPAFA